MPTRTRATDLSDPVVRQLQEQLDRVPLVSFVTIEHVAGGSTATEIRVAWGVEYGTIVGTRPPQAALVVRCQPVLDESGNPGNLRPVLNFDFDGSEVVLPEPEGLTADTKYRLTVMFLG